MYEIVKLINEIQWWVFTYIRAVDKYNIDDLAQKEVVLFLGEADNSLIKIQVEEIEDYRWCNYEDAQKLLTFESGRRILDEGNRFLCSLIKGVN